MTEHPGTFGIAPDGTPVRRLRIANGGASAHVLSWGARLQDFLLEGVGHSLILGGPDPEAYLGPMKYFGAIVGPLANRIAGGRLALDGEEFRLEPNERGKTTLHGGTQGFGTRNWEVVRAGETSVTLGLDHPDGLGGFPGAISARVTYGLDAAGALTIEIEGSTERTTVFGPAFHGYWSLDGAPDLSGHRLRVDADSYLPVDGDLIPQGAPAPVEGTAFDYRAPRPPHDTLDHNFCLADQRGTMRPACTLDAAGLRLEVTTTEAGLQVYSGAKIATAPFPGHHGRPYGPHAGIAIEPQFWPDAPNHPDYPSPVLRPGQTYRQVSRFAVTRTD